MNEVNSQNSYYQKNSTILTSTGENPEHDNNHAYKHVHRHSLVETQLDLSIATRKGLVY